MLSDLTSKTISHSVRPVSSSAVLPPKGGERVQDPPFYRAHTAQDSGIS